MFALPAKKLKFAAVTCSSLPWPWPLALASFGRDSRQLSHGPPLWIKVQFDRDTVSFAGLNLQPVALQTSNVAPKGVIVTPRDTIWISDGTVLPAVMLRLQLSLIHCLVIIIAP